MGENTDILLHAENIRHSYREGEKSHTVLNGASLGVARGESVAIRGRSGSGKSTLLNMLGAIDAPDEGRIVIDGTDITRLDEHGRTLFRRKALGFVYQSFNLIPTLNVGDNIALVLELNGITGKAARDRVTALLKQVSLADRAESFPDTLSGGEQQRVAIARALSHRPTLLIADEPTGNLDDQTATGVLDLLRDLLSEEGASMVVATHSSGLAASCDRRLEMHDGRPEPIA